MKGRLLSIAAALALLSAAIPSSLHAVAPILPDLGMAELRGFSVEVAGSQTQLRFTAIIINVGQGPFQVFGHDKTNGEFFVDQQIKNSDGSWTSQSTQARMYFAGDGHNHWHLRDLESYEFQSTTNSTNRAGEKHGFCFFDNYVHDLSLPGAPQSLQYPKGMCGKIDSTQVTTGLSVGYGDRYTKNLPDQYINITGLPAGDYTLTATADANHQFTELCENNNSTTVVIRLKATGGVKVLDHGQDSVPC
jgi:hypothetical protein